MNNLVKTTVKISDLEQGMTVELNGQLITVSKKDIRHDELFGYCFRGDCSKKTITRVQFLVPTNLGLQLR